MAIADLMLAPVQASMRKWWAWQHPVVPVGYKETHWMNGFLVDNVSYPGHPRIIFGSLFRPLTSDICGVQLVSDSYQTREGVANVRYFFTERGKYTWLPDANKFFAWNSVMSPTYCWRVRANQHERIDELEQSLRDGGYNRQAEKLAQMRAEEAIILVAQLNRSWIKLYNLSLEQDDVHLYQAFCYGPSLI